MSVSTFIAVRYFKSSRENRFFSWISLLSVAGIAIGVAAMIVVLSVIDGFQTELRKRFLHANAHIMAYRYPAGLEQPERWAEEIKKDFPDDVKAVAPFVHSETMARNGAIMPSVTLRGVNPRLREGVQSLKGMIHPDAAIDMLQAEIDAHDAGKVAPALPAIVLGTGLLSILNLKVGDVIQLVDPSGQSISDLKSFKIVGVYDSGLKHYDNKVAAMSLTTAQDFLNMNGRVTGLEIGLFDPDSSPEVTKRMEDRYTLSMREWQSFNRPMFEAMKMEKAVIGLIVALVAFVASFNILTTLFVSVSQKQREISILKALGAKNRQIIALFINQGCLIGVLGGVFGVVLAFGISELLKRYQFIDLPDPYFLSRLPINFDWRVYATVALSGVAICIVAGLYPAMVAARVSPTEGFRGTGKAF